MKHVLSLFILLFTLCAFPAAAETTHSIGFGAHYWQVLDDIDFGDFDSSGLSYMGVYRFDGGLLALQPELEVFGSDFGTATETVYSPQILAILGDGLYVGIGAGILYSGGDFANKPFYMFRAGFGIPVFGPITLDINANYVFTDFDNLSSSDINSDTITLGAMLRWEFK